MRGSLFPLALLLTFLALACDGGGEKAQPTPTPSPPVAQPSPTPEPTPTATSEPRIRRIAYIGTDRGDVWIINVDGSGRQKLFDLPTEQGDQLHWSPDGSKLAVTESPKDVIYIVSAEGEKLLELPAVRFLTWSPKGDTFAVARGPALEVEPAIVLLDLQGHALLEFSNIQIVDQAYFSPDGRRLTFYEFAGGGGLCGDYRGLLADLQTGEVRPIDPTEPPIPCGKGPPIFSPTNPSLLAYGDSLIDLDTGRVQPLPGRAVRWSPDGRFVVLACGSVDAQVFNVETSAPVLQFDVSPDFSDQPCESLISGRTGWSPDSSLLAAADFFPDKPAVLHIRDIDTGGDKTLSISARRFGFQFSPDRRYLLISSDDDSIWLVNSDGSGLTLLAEGRWAAWQPQP